MKLLDMSHPPAPERQNTSNKIHTGKSKFVNRRQRRSVGVYCQLLIKVLKKNNRICAQDVR